MTSNEPVKGTNEQMDAGNNPPDPMPWVIGALFVVPAVAVGLWFAMG